MRLQDMYYPLIVLICLEVIVVLAAFGDDKRNIVGNDQHNYKHSSKVKGRHRPSYQSLHEKKLAPAEPETKREHNNKPHGSPVESPPKMTPKAAEENVLPTKAAAPLQAGISAESDDKKKGNQTKGVNHEVATLPGGGGLIDQMMDMKTVFFILLGISSLVIAYFVIRMARSKSRRKTKKYGVLATHGSEVELRPLEQDDDDEDMTVFDANSH